MTMTMPPRRCGAWRAPLLLGLALACGGASLAAQTLPAAWPTPVSRLELSQLPPPYALVARPPFGERANGVDVVMLDKATLQPLSRSPTTLSCQRVHVASRSGEVLCFTHLQPGEVNHFIKPTSFLYTPDLRPAGASASPSNGRPSRARMSADGRYSATTEFATGHSYLGVGGTSFSTATRVVRNASPQSAQDLQDWPLLLPNGQRVTSPDLNLWGVSFDPAQAERFFVTAYFDGRPRLAEGHLAQRSLRVWGQEEIECPSLSPDGLRLAFKKRSSATTWSPAVMELASGKVTVFDIGHSVDDQIEWLDKQTLVFELITRPLIGPPRNDLMALDIDTPRPAPRLWLAQARSPGFVRK